MRDSALKQNAYPQMEVGCKRIVGEELMRDSALKLCSCRAHKFFYNHWSEKSSCATAL